MGWLNCVKCGMGYSTSIRRVGQKCGHLEFFGPTEEAYFCEGGVYPGGQPPERKTLTKKRKDA